MMPVAILAGGRATRLGEVAKHIPKSLVDVAGKPFVAHQLALLRRHGITDVVVCTGHLSTEIEAAVGDGRSHGLSVRYSHDGPVPLGTGGALRAARPLLGEAFLVLYGDSYLDCDYRAVAEAFATSGRLGLMTVVRNDDRWDRSNVEFGGGEIVCYSKTERSPQMQHIDYGLTALRAAALERYATDQPLDLAAVFQDLLAQRQLAAHEVTGRFYEIGSPAGLEETRAYLARKEARV